MEVAVVSVTVVVVVAAVIHCRGRAVFRGVEVFPDFRKAVT